jgi:hypothetical protein
MGWDFSRVHMLQSGVRYERWFNSWMSLKEISSCFSNSVWNLL